MSKFLPSIKDLTAEEIHLFTRAQRRIMTMKSAMHKDDEELCDILDIQPATLRFHLANIRKTFSEIRMRRSDARTEDDVKRHKEKKLPDVELKDDDDTEQTDVTPEGGGDVQGEHTSTPPLPPESFEPGRLKTETPENIPASSLPRPADDKAMFGLF